MNYSMSFGIFTNMFVFNDICPLGYTKLSNKSNVMFIVVMDDPVKSQVYST